MKILSLNFVLILVITLIVSCTSNTNDNYRQKTEVNKEFVRDNLESKTPVQKKPKNTVAKNKAANKLTYGDALAKELNLSPEKTQGIKKINEELKKQRKLILKNNKTQGLSKQQQLSLRDLRSKKLVKFLGEDLFKKKQDFDKKWNNRQKPNYIALLAKELELNIVQKAGVKKIIEEFQARKQQIVKRNKTQKLNPKQLEGLNQLRDFKLKKLLGAELYKRKLNFDRKRKRQ